MATSVVTPAPALVVRKTPMVATILKLRYRILGNSLMRSPWQLVGFILGGLAALSFIVPSAIGLLFLGHAGIGVTHTVIVMVGTALTLGWVIAPLIVAGIDTTVDPGRLAPFPLTRTQVMFSITAIGLFGVAGIATRLGATALVLAWWRWPLALVAAIVCAPLGVLIAVVASRLIATFASSSGGGRRIGQVVGIVAFFALILAGPIMLGIMNIVEGTAGLAIDPRQIADAAGWTPVGAAWAVPGDVLEGRIVPAIAKFIIALATLALLWILWSRALAVASVTPVRLAARVQRAGSHGWFGRARTGPIGATWARAMTYWLRDPRYLRQLLTAPLLPIVFAFAGQGVLDGAFLFSGVITAAVLGLVPYADVSYDGTAFAGVLATGIRGREDRAGRLFAAASIGLPLIVVITVITVGISGEWSMLPGIVGAAIGALLVGYGVSAVSSSLLVIPVPEPGDNMFKRVPGATFGMGMAFFGCLAATAVLALPATIVAIIAVVQSNVAMSWVAAAVGVGVGIAAMLGGIFGGGRIFDRNAPVLLQRLKTMRGV